MSIETVEYIPCLNCLHTLIEKTEKSQRIAEIGRIIVLEITNTWLCLKCCHIQEQRAHIQEVREN